MKQEYKKIDIMKREFIFSVDENFDLIMRQIFWIKNVGFVEDIMTIKWDNLYE